MDLDVEVLVSYRIVNDHFFNKYNIHTRFNQQYNFTYEWCILKRYSCFKFAYLCIDPVDVCSGVICMAGGTCIKDSAKPEGYRCACKAGYGGSHCADEYG